MNERLLLRVNDAAERLSISRSMLYRLIAAGEIRAVHVGSVLRVPMAELERWVQQRAAAEAGDER